jgi:methionyl aminopeptidase
MPLSPEVSNFIRGMEKAGRVAAETLKYAGSLVKPGANANEVDQAILEFIESKGAKAASLGYHGYPKASCISPNDVICHGLPGDWAFKDGDIVNVDLAVIVDGYFGDNSCTYLIGNVTERAKDIVDCAQKAMFEGIQAITPNGTTGDIGFAINKYVTRRGYYPVKEIGGHGIGRKYHDEPFVPSFGKKGKGDRLKPFSCITVEPMINENDKPYDEYSIPNSSIMFYKTVDGSLSAQFEHTILITDSGYEILTQV